MTRQLAIAVQEPSQIGEARRAAATIGEIARLSPTVAGRAAIVVTELATNLARYAQKGFILLRADVSEQNGSLEIIAIDSGPGFDAARCLVDGYSTGGTPGNGLGAVQRLASTFEVYSSQPQGSVILARMTNDARPTVGNLDWSCIAKPAPFETVCGDAWNFSHRNSAAAFMIADGLGHGPDAAAASEIAARIFQEDPFTPANSFIEAAHRAMSGTRGAAVSIASCDGHRGTLRYAGVGNIAGTLLFKGGRQGLPSQNGIVGARLPNVKFFEYPLPTDGVLVMHSDGLQSRWSLDPYPGILYRHPAIIAGVLFRDFCRERDDVTVLVGAWKRGLS